VKRTSVVDLLLNPIDGKLKFSISDDDLALLNLLNEHAEQYFPEFIKDFSLWLPTIPELAASKSVFNIKGHHYKSHLFPAQIDQRYVKAIYQTGEAAIAEKITSLALSSVFNFLTLWWLDRIDQITPDFAIKERQRLAFSKVRVLDLALILDIYHREFFGRFEKSSQATLVVNRITTALEKITQGEESSIKSGLSLLDKVIKGEHNLFTFAQKTISFLCRYLEAVTGTFYVVFDEDYEKRLRIVGVFVANSKRTTGMELSLLENPLLNRAMSTKKMIVSSDVAEGDHLTVSTVFGGLIPKHRAILPIIFDGEVNGLVEIGSYKAFSDNDLKLVEGCCHAVSSSIKIHNSRHQIRNLLEQSKAQTLKLETQKEKLKKSYEALKSIDRPCAEFNAAQL
jgi:hypothetical protein